KVDSDPQIGDYPAVPWVHYEEKDPYKYWDRQGRRNFSEPVHEQDEILNAFAPDASSTPLSTAFYSLGVCASGIALTCLIIGYFRAESPHVKRTYPYGGLGKELG
ncbi:hypothetical protein SYNPS1DRAFT_9458, partial [Syncephalis pseudoplumigaleata]